MKIRHGTEVSEYPLSSTMISIGREDDNQVVLKDASVSGQHALIGWASGAPRITDLNSTGGTVVNVVAIKPQ